MVAPNGVGGSFPCRQEGAKDPREIWGRVWFFSCALPSGVCNVVKESEVVEASDYMQFATCSIITL